MSVALLCPWLALSACTLSTKLGELSETGDETGGDDTTGAPTPTTGTSSPNLSGGDACVPVKVTYTALSPNVVLVLDKSGSMVSGEVGLWDHDDDPMTPDVTRWSSLHAVVEAILLNFDDSIAFGAHLVPGVDAKATYSDSACTLGGTIDIPVAEANMSAVLAGIPAGEAIDLKGGTPTSAGVATALAHLKTLDPEVPRAIVLVTDGAANCADGAVVPGLFEAYDDGVHDVVGDAFTVDGVPTYVVGIGIEDVKSPVLEDGNPDSTNTFDRLNDLALDGGRPRSDPDQKFYNTVNQIELAAALDEIAVDALTCIVPLQAALAGPEAAEIEVGGAPIAHVDDCASQSGWVFTHASGPFDSISLCGGACTGLKLTGSADVTACIDDG